MGMGYRIQKTGGLQMSKLIYTPKGAAREYAKYACNIFTGCSGKCTYCYNRKGIPSKVLGADVSSLKKSWDIGKFETELAYGQGEYRKHGIFFSFVSDPLLLGNYGTMWKAIGKCLSYCIPVIVLTKQALWVNEFVSLGNCQDTKIAFGFTLTGHDEMEPGCATNDERIDAMRKLKEAGYKTWASIEPVINFADSLMMIEKSAPYCDHYKIGLKSGWRPSTGVVTEFVVKCITSTRPESKIYFKDSITSIVHGTNELYGVVGRDYSMFSKP